MCVCVSGHACEIEASRNSFGLLCARTDPAVTTNYYRYYNTNIGTTSQHPLKFKFATVTINLQLSPFMTKGITNILIHNLVINNENFTECSQNLCKPETSGHPRLMQRATSKASPPRAAPSTAQVYGCRRPGKAVYTMPPPAYAVDEDVRIRVALQVKPRLRVRRPLVLCFFLQGRSLPCAGRRPRAYNPTSQY